MYEILYLPAGVVSGIKKLKSLVVLSLAAKSKGKSSVISTQPLGN
jgi:hypothetical protein